MARGEVRTNITGDSSQLKRELGEADKAVSRFAGNVDRHNSSAAASMQKVASETEKSTGRMSRALDAVTPGLMAGAAAFGAFALYGIKGAADIGEAMNVAKHTFGEASDEMQWFAKNAADTAGLSEREFLDIATSIGALLAPMGIVQDEAAKMSASLTQRAADIGSFFNATAADVQAAMTSALAGETEPMRKFGVFLDQDRIKAEALLLGLAKAPIDMAKVEKAQLDITKAQNKYNDAVAEYGPASMEAKDAQLKITAAQARLGKALKGGKVDLDAAAKAQAIYSLMMKDSTIAAGDFGETLEDSLPNQTKAAKAEFENLATALGERLLPVAVDVLKRINDGLDDLKVWWDETGSKWFEDFKLGWADLGAGVDEFKVQWDELVESYEGWTGESGGWTAFAKHMEDAGWGVDNFKRGWDTLVESFPVGVGMIADAIGEVLGNMYAVAEFVFGNIFGGMQIFFGNLWNVIQWVGEKLGWLIDQIEKVPDALGGLVDWIAPGDDSDRGGGFFAFDMGGVVPGPKGAPQLALVHGGETILPTHKENVGYGGGGSTVVNVHLDGKQIATVVAPHLANDRRSRTGSRKVA